MPINKNVSNLATVVFEKEVYERLKDVAKKNKRSISKQIAYYVELALDAEKKSEN